jgi:hypothetical protein
MRVASVPIMPLGGALSLPRITAVSAISPDVDSPNATNDIPSQVVDGNIVLAHFGAAGPGANPTFSVPAGEGWLEVTSGYDSTGADMKAALYWKRWGAGGQTDNTNVTFQSTLGNSRLVLSLMAGAVGSGTPYSAAASLVGSSLAMTTMLIAGSVLVPTNGLLLRFYAACGTAINTTPDAEPSIYSGASYGWTAGVDGSCAASALAAPPGFSASSTATASATPVNGWTTFSLALEGDGSLTPSVLAVSAISTNTNAQDATNTVPGTPATDNIVLAQFCNVAASAPVFTPPAGEGWSLITQIETQSGANSKSALYWKRWGAGGQTDNTVVTFASNGGNSRLVLTLIENAKTTGNPYGSEAFVAQCDDASADMASTSPSAAIALAQSAVVRFYMATAPGISLNAPMVEKYDGAAYSWNTGTNAAVASSWLRALAAGTAPLRSAQSNVATENGWVGLTAVFPPY